MTTWQEPPEPAQIAALRRELAAVDSMTLQVGVMPLIDAARAVLAEWDRGVTIRAGCPQCGKPYTVWACGPTHAIRRAELGLTWDGVDPRGPFPMSEFTLGEPESPL